MTQTKNGLPAYLNDSKSESNKTTIEREEQQLANPSRERLPLTPPSATWAA